MTRFAFGAKCKAGRAPRVFSAGSASAANSRSLSREARATVPIPVAVRPKKWRRVSRRSRSRSGFIGTSLGRGEEQISEDSGRLRHRGRVDRVRRAEQVMGGEDPEDTESEPDVPPVAKEDLV